MKKLIVLLLTVTMIMCLVACGKKKEESSEQQVEITAENSNAAETTNSETAAKNDEEIPEGDPVEYGQDFWAQKFPDENICPFYINIDGVDYSYYWVRSVVPEDDIASWATTEMNWNGWHMVGDKLVDKDEKHAITQESREMSFSSGCVYETESFDASAASSANEGDTSAATSTAYNFKGYTETADWLDENSWAGLGLPNLTMSDDVNGTVHISDKDWIYPLNGSDGVLIECTPGSSMIDAIIADLQNAGINMTEDSDFFKGYVGTYSYAGNNMKITVSETEIGKLSILVVTNPTD